MDLTNLLWPVVISVVILIIILMAIINNKKNKDKNNLPFEINILFDLLGGKDNIIEYQSSLSKISFKLKDNSLVKIDQIKELGASGIVETSDGFSFIFGSISKLIAQELAKKLK